MFGGATTTEYDDIVVKTTDENLTSENWELIMNLCDKVAEEGQTGAHSAIAAILKRLAHRNPNVQLYTLSLAEALSKNLGIEVHREIASRAFTQGLEKLITDRNTHDKVRKRALGLVVTWMEDFEKDSSLGIMEDCYNNLKAKNYKFDQAVEPTPPQVDDEIRRKEEEELQKVLEMSRQDKGGRNQWTQYSVAGSSSGVGGGSSSSTAAAISNSAPGSSHPFAQPKYQAGYVPARTPSPVDQPTPKTTQPPQQSQPQAQSYSHYSAALSSASAPSPHSSTSAPAPAPAPAATTSTTATSPTSASSPGSVNIVTRVRALHTFEPTEPGELAFEKGEIIKVVDRGYKDWWRGQLKGRTGIFPVNYVEPMPEPTANELAKEAEQEAAVFSQAVNVEKLLNTLRSMDPAKDNLADNEEVQELYRSCMALRPKIVKLIDKYSQKRADLVSMNETFVRARTIFDRMMEESLARHTGVYDQPTYRPPPQFHPAQGRPDSRSTAQLSEYGPRPVGWNPTVFDQPGYNAYPAPANAYPGQLGGPLPQQQPQQPPQGPSPYPVQTPAPGSIPGQVPAAYGGQPGQQPGQQPQPQQVGGYQYNQNQMPAQAYGQSPYPVQQQPQQGPTPYPAQQQPQQQQPQQGPTPYPVSQQPQQQQQPAQQPPLQQQPSYQSILPQNTQSSVQQPQQTAQQPPLQQQPSYQTQPIQPQSAQSSIQQPQQTAQQPLQQPSYQAQPIQPQSSVQQPQQTAQQPPLQHQPSYQVQPAQPQNSQSPIQQPELQQPIQGLNLQPTQFGQQPVQQPAQEIPLQQQHQSQQPEHVQQQPIQQQQFGMEQSQQGIPGASRSPQQQQQQLPQQAQQELQREEPIPGQPISGPPPYQYDPRATYADPNVQAWAQYYAQGGRDLAGAVYFHSIPGVTDSKDPGSPQSQPAQSGAGFGQPQQQGLGAAQPYQAQNGAQQQSQPQSGSSGGPGSPVGRRQSYQATSPVQAQPNPYSQPLRATSETELSYASPGGGISPQQQQPAAGSFQFRGVQLSDGPGPSSASNPNPMQHAYQPQPQTNPQQVRQSSPPAGQGSFGGTAPLNVQNRNSGGSWTTGGSTPSWVLPKKGAPASGANNGASSSAEELL